MCGGVGGGIETGRETETERDRQREGGRGGAKQAGILVTNRATCAILTCSLFRHVSAAFTSH